MCDRCWVTSPKDPQTTNQHSQCCSYLHYLPVSSANAAEMTGVKQSDLITRSGGGPKLLYHISILTPQTSSGRPHWNHTRNQTRPVRPRIHVLRLIDSKNVIIVSLEPQKLEFSKSRLCSGWSWFIPNTV